MEHIYSFACFAIVVATLSFASDQSMYNACFGHAARIDMRTAVREALPNFDMSDYVKCTTNTAHCIIGERHITEKRPRMPSNSVVKGTDLNGIAHLAFSWCYEDSPLVDYVLNNTHASCAVRDPSDDINHRIDFGDYYVTFYCEPVVQHFVINDAPNFVDDNSEYSMTTFDYVHAYATLPFLAFHVSLIVVLCRASRHDSTFREGFFVLFVILSVFDAVTIVHDNLFAFCPPLNRLTEIPTGNSPLETSLASDIGVFVSCYCYIYQPLAHVVIACNRFNAFRSPNEYHWNWRDSSLKIVIWIEFIVPLLLVASVLPFHYGTWWNDLVEARKLVYLLLHFYRTSFLLVGSCVGFALTVFAVNYIRKWSSREYSQVDSHEKRLLGYSFVMLVVQLWVGFWCGVEYFIADERNVVSYFETSWRPLWYQSTLTFATRIYCLGGSIFLVCSSASVRCQYFTFYRIRRPSVVPVFEATPARRRHTVASVFGRLT